MVHVPPPGSDHETLLWVFSILVRSAWWPEFLQKSRFRQRIDRDFGIFLALRTMFQIYMACRDDLNVILFQNMLK